MDQEKFNLTSIGLLTKRKRSSALVEIAAKRNKAQCAVVVADMLALPHKQHTFDFAIAIAVVHHLSTPERRIEAITALLGMLRDYGQALIYVWALEQEGSRRGWSAEDDQDVLVPWVMRGAGNDKGADTVFQRFYHLYRRGELETDIEAAGGVVIEAGYEKDNWWAIATRRKTSSELHRSAQTIA